MNWIPNRYRAWVGGGAATAVAIIGTLLVNFSTQGETKVLLESMLPATRFFCSAVMSATATILALLLTLLTFSGNVDFEMKSEHYERIKFMAKVAAFVLTFASVLLLFVAVPIVENADEVPIMAYNVIYYTIFITSSLIGGGLVMVVILLYQAIISLIHITHPEHESDLIRNEEQIEQPA